MEYEKKLEEAKELYKTANADQRYALERIFSELKEGKGEKIKNLIYCLIRDRSDNGKLLEHNGVTVKEALAWLEKQGKTIDKEKVLIGARKDIALSIMNFLDRNTLGMCLSNMECADLESAVVDLDWSKVYDYMKKKLEKRGESKPADKIEPKFHEGEWITIKE